MDSDNKNRTWEVTRVLKYRVEIERIEDREESRQDAIQEAKLRPTSEADEEFFKADLLIGPNQI